MNWKLLPLQDVVETFIDYRGKTPKKTETGIPLITAKIIKNGTILDPTEYISPDDYDEWMRRGIPQYGDIVITTEAPLGEVAQLKIKDRFALAQRVITIRGKINILDNTFLKYALWFEPVQGELSGRASGTTVQGIKSSELKKVKIPVPPYPVQRKIGDLLGSLDEKIELNRHMNETLEQMAMTLYKHWLVDFGPFQDGEFEESELGMIPKGWEVKSIGYVSENYNSKRIPLSSVKRQEMKGKYPYYGAAGIVDHVDSFLFSGKYLLVGEDGS
ncbi:restriction endonuclease subunit S, partial [Paenibacillus paridis]